MVVEAMSQDPGLSLNGAVIRIGPRVGVVPDTLRGWIKQLSARHHVELRIALIGLFCDQRFPWTLTCFSKAGPGSGR